jgi:hypothetical protein
MTKKTKEPEAPKFPPIPRGRYDMAIDIETSPLPLDRLESTIPPFDRDSVKTGNWPKKDPEAIAAKWKEAEEKHRSKYVDDAALDAKTGFVMVFGFKAGDLPTQLAVAETIEDEKFLLQYVTDLFHWWGKGGGHLIVFNGKSFDLKFLIRRCWLQGLRRPRGLIEYYRGRMQWSSLIRDLYDEWLLPNPRSEERLKGGNGLDGLCKANLGVGKIGTGLNFHQQYLENKIEALKYAADDVDKTAALNEWMFGPSPHGSLLNQPC